MVNLKEGFKKVILFIFVLFALLKTYEGISGIKVIVPLKEWLLFSTEKNVQAATTEAIIPFDENIDLSQFPREVVVATGYTAGYESTGKHPDHPQFGITYSGVKVTRDLFSTVAADLDIFPIGTILYIPGYGYGVVADKGGAIKGKKVDLYYETVEDVYKEWGKKTVEVYILKMGDGTLTEEKLKALNENKTMAVLQQKFIEAHGQ